MTSTTAPVITRDFTACEVAEMFSVSKRKVLYLLETKALLGYRVGTAWRVTPAAVDEFRRKNSNAPQDNVRTIRGAK